MIAISTAYKEALIAIEIDSKKTFKSLDSNCKHSENLLYNIDKMLDDINCSIRDNKSLAVVVGPGSFTGIRISIALAKGIRSAMEGDNSINLIKLTTFDLMAYSYIKNNKPDKDFYCAINALSGLYYICRYDKRGNKLGDEKLIDTETFKKLKGIVVSLEEEGITDEVIKPTPEELLEISKIMEEKGLFIDENQLLPLYLRKSQAELSLKLKENNTTN